MNFFRSRLFQAALVLVIAFVFFRFAIRPPAPFSVLSLYMALAVLVFVSSNADSWQSFLRPMRATIVDSDRRLLRLVVMILIPVLLGYYAYTQAAAKPQAPPELRAVHPAPPDAIQFKGKEFKIAGVENPLRKDQAAFAKQVGAGGEIYIRNCMYCH